MASKTVTRSIGINNKVWSNQKKRPPTLSLCTATPSPQKKMGEYRLAPSLFRPLEIRTRNFFYLAFSGGRPHFWAFWCLISPFLQINRQSGVEWCVFCSTWKGNWRILVWLNIDHEYPTIPFGFIYQRRLLLCSFDPLQLSFWRL